MARLSGQVTLVTGGASGIGRATVELFAREGARAMVGDVNYAEAERVAALIQASGGEAFPAVLDVASEAAWELALRDLLDRWGRLDVLVNCAGISFAKPVTEMSLEEWRRVHAVNLDGVFLGTRAALRVMGARGAGCITNIASISGLEAYPTAAAYGSSKAAVIHFSKVAARECEQAGNGVRVYAVAPGGVKTAMWKTMPFWAGLATEGEEAAWRKIDPANSFLSPEDVAGVILKVVANAASHPNGSVLVLNRPSPE